MIHEESDKAIKYVKGIDTERGFEVVPEEEIVKGYEHHIIRLLEVTGVDFMLSTILTIWPTATLRVCFRASRITA